MCPLLLRHYEPLLTDLIQNQAGERESNKENTGVERSFVRRHWSHGLEEKRTLWSIKSTRNQENLRGGGLVEPERWPERLSAY